MAFLVLKPAPGDATSRGSGRSGDLPPLDRSQVRRFLGGPIAEELLRRRERWCVGAFGLFCVERTHDGTVVGLLTVEPGVRDGHTEISYDFLPEFWGNGYAREAASHVLEWIRANFADSPEVVAVAQEANTASRRLLEALGAIRTGSQIEFGALQAVYTFPTTA